MAGTKLHTGPSRIFPIGRTFFLASRQCQNALCNFKQGGSMSALAYQANRCVSFFVGIFIFLVTQLSVSGPAFAGGAMGGKATEITQIMNNVELTLMAMQDYTRNLTLAKQLYVDTLQQAKGTVDPGTYANTMAGYQNVTSTLSAVERLYGSTSNVKQGLTARMNQFSASGLDWQSYVQREKDRAAMNRNANTILTDYETRGLDQMKENYEAVQRHQANIQGSEGTHSAMMAMNGQMNSLLATTTQMQEQALIKQRFETERQAITDSEDEAGRQRMQKEYEDQKKMHDMNKKRLGF